MTTATNSLQNESLTINVGDVVRSRLSRLSKFIPKWAIRKLEKLICQDELNELLNKTAGLTGAEFARAILKELNVSIKVRNEHLLPPVSHRRLVFISNHPLGGLDGMALISEIQQKYGGQIWFIVNDLLMAVKPLRNVFLPINKHGKQTRENANRIDDAFAGNDPIIIFPAGMVSRLKDPADKNNKEIADLKWNKMFLSKSIKYNRKIVPLFFSGRNSDDFYQKAALREKIRLKFNYEMILLPREVIRMRNAHLGITFGKAFEPRIPSNESPDDVILQIRKDLYHLEQKN